MKVILVTGGAGFIGSNFIKHFLKRNRNFIMVNMDKQIYSSGMNRLQELESSPRYHQIKGDICNRELVEYALRKYRPEWIVNFCSDPYSTDDPKRIQSYAETSITGTLTLLEGARYIWTRSGFQGKRFIQISSDDLYGHTTDRNERFSEESPLLPDNPCLAAKAGADLMVSSYHKAYKFPSVILRSCRNYGPWQGMHSFIPSCIKRALTNETAEHVENASTHEWLHVSDHCSAITKALFYSKPGEIYNIGSNEAYSEEELEMKIFKLCSRPEEKLSTAAQRYEAWCRMNCYKAESNLTWYSKYDINEGLADTVKWYEYNRSLWEGK